MLERLTNQLAASRHLSEEQIILAVEALVDEVVPASAKADFLCQLALKGETIEEIAAFARALRAKSRQPELDPATRARGVLDVCGTGGDRLNTFNISTTVAIMCAAAGVAVAKHGNRAITSQAGSADVLEALGVRIDLPPAEAARSLAEHGFAFFFAPNYHPAFKHIAPARKLCAGRGQRTIFNFLGPLLNPARPSAQLVGVPRPELCEPLARVLQSLGVRRAMVVCGRVGGGQNGGRGTENGRPAEEGAGWSMESQAVVVERSVGVFLDELSTLGENTIAEFYQERGFAASVLEGNCLPFQAAKLSDLAGGDRQTNAATVRGLLRGEDRGPKRDAVLLNTAAALLVADRARTLADGWELAASLIDSGQARRKLEELSG